MTPETKSGLMANALGLIPDRHKPQGVLPVFSAEPVPLSYDKEKGALEELWEEEDADLL